MSFEKGDRKKQPARSNHLPEKQFGDPRPQNFTRKKLSRGKQRELWGIGPPRTDGRKVGLLTIGKKPKKGIDSYGLQMQGGGGKPYGKITKIRYQNWGKGRAQISTLKKN